MAPILRFVTAPADNDKGKCGGPQRVAHQSFAFQKLCGFYHYVQQGLDVYHIKSRGV